MRSTHRRVDEILTYKTLELLHMDLMALMRTESLGGKKYILVPICGTCQKGKQRRSTHCRPSILSY